MCLSVRVCACLYVCVHVCVRVYLFVYVLLVCVCQILELLVIVRMGLCKFAWMRVGALARAMFCLFECVRTDVYVCL